MKTNKVVTPLIKLVFVIGGCLLSYLLWLLANIPHGSDDLIADKVGKLIAQQYQHFPDRAVVEKSGHGQIYYSHPGAFSHPRVDLYEVTSDQDIALIEQATRQALAQAHARAVTLRFFEKQNITLFASGGRGHGREHLIKSEVITQG